MGLFDFIRTELIDIIEWLPPTESDLIAWKFPRHDNEIKNGAKLIVREGQQALFVNMGQLADTFGPGMQTLETKNLPLLSTLLGWKYGFDSPFKADVYFVATRRFTDMKWGTANPVVMRDPEFGMVRVRAFGTYAIQVTNPAVFLRQLLGTDPSFATYEIAGQLRTIILTRASAAIAATKMSVLDMAANLNDLSTLVQQQISKDFAEMGFSVPIFLIENISLPENVERALDKRTSMGMIGNMDQYMKYQAAESLEKSAENPAQGGAAGMGVGLGAGFGMANMMMGAMQAPWMGGQQAGAGAVPPPVLPAVQFYAALGGQQCGPFDAATLQGQVRSGAITRETLVWRQGMANWAQAGTVPELANWFQAVPPPMPG